jgi:hypothetical protein
MASFRRSRAARLTLALALALGAGGAAQAQFFFQPFGGAYRSDLPPPPPDDERPRYATPRAVSRILARRGFELVSGLGRRGDQVVVTGVSRRDGTVRFFIDPYEGEVIHAMRLAPPEGDAAWAERMDRTAPDRLASPGREAQRRPPRQATQSPLPGPAPTVDPVAKGPVSATQPAKPVEAATRSETKPAELSKPAEPAKVEPPKPEVSKVEAPKAEASKPETAKGETPGPEKKTEAAKSVVPPPAAAAIPKDTKAVDARPAEKAEEAKPAPAVAARPGVPGRRAIVAPKNKDGGAAMAQPPANQ